MDPSVLLAITHAKETAQTEQHVGRERVVRLIKDILADPGVTADGNVQAEQSTAADFNNFVCNSNDPYRAKRVR